MIIRFIDLETTGDAPPEHGVVEIASLDLIDDAIGGGEALLINPGRPIPPEASAIHHLVDAHVADGKALSDVAPILLMLLRPDALADDIREVLRQAGRRNG